MKGKNMVEAKNVTIISACDLKGCIGRDGEIPWRLPEDIKMFKELTTGYPVVMGRKTYESLPPKWRPLPNRQNIVVTRQKELFPAENFFTAHSLQEALAVAESGKHIFVTGGAEIYRLALPWAQRIILTVVDTIVPDGDTFVPEFRQLEKSDQWKQVAKVDHKADAKNEHAFSVEVWQSTTNPLPSHFYLGSTRYLDQLVRMLSIESAGVCSFCFENITRFHRGKILFETKNWCVAENGWPYEGTETHLLIIPRTHVEELFELSTESWLDLGETLNRLVEELKLTGYSLFCRFGDMAKTGATVAHLHFHLIAGKGVEGQHPPIKVKLGFGVGGA